MLNRITKTATLSVAAAATKKHLFSQGTQRTIQHAQECGYDLIKFGSTDELPHPTKEGFTKRVIFAMFYKDDQAFGYRAHELRATVCTTNTARAEANDNATRWKDIQPSTGVGQYVLSLTKLLGTDKGVSMSDRDVLRDVAEDMLSRYLMDTPTDNLAWRDTKGNVLPLGNFEQLAEQCKQ